MIKTLSNLLKKLNPFHKEAPLPPYTPRPTVLSSNRMIDPVYCYGEIVGYSLSETVTTWSDGSVTTSPGRMYWIDEEKQNG